MLAPSSWWIRLVEPHAEGELLPQPFDLRLAEDLPRPALVRSAHTATVDAVLAQLLHADLHHLVWHGAPDTLAVEVGEQVRLRVADRREESVAGHCGHELLQPSGRIGERLVWPQLDHRPL